MARLSVRISVALLFACSMASLGAPLRAAEPAAEARAAAQQAHRRALTLYDRGQHAAALVEFERAYALSPAFRLRYNIALAHVALNDPAAALAAFEAYLHEGAERISAERRAQVEQEIERLTALVARVEIDVEEPGAELSVDGKLEGRGPFSGKLWLNPGRRTLAVKSPDGTLKTQTLTVGAGEKQQLRFRVQLPGSTTAPAAAPQPGRGAGDAAQPGSTTPWIAWGITGALGAAALGAGIVAVAAHADEETVKGRAGVRREELLAARDKVQHWALATDVLLVGTALAAGASLYLTLRGDPSTDRATAVVLAPGALGVRQVF